MEVVIIARKLVLFKKFGSYFYKIVFNDLTKYYTGDILSRKGGIQRVIDSSPASKDRAEAIHFAKRKIIWITKNSKGLY